MRLRRGKALSRVALCGALILASAGVAAAETEQPGTKAEKKDELLLPAVPIIGYSKETNLLFGVMVVRALRWKDAAPETRPNTVALSGFFSLENQWAVGIAPSVYLRGEDYLVKTQFYVHRTPARMWGIGNEAGEHGAREDFTANGTGLTLSATKKVFRSLRIGPGIWYGSAKIPVKEEGGLLESTAVNGSDGGDDVGVELLAEWDGRDNIYAPTTGTYVQFWAGLHREDLGSDFDYEDYLLDVRRFFHVGEGKVLAVQAKGRIMNGDPPFYRLPNIGGISVMRGLYEGRFRDKTMAAAQVEYRFPIWDILGGVVFAGLGEVAERPGDLSLKDLKVAGGVGLRITLDPKERINLRIDVGFSKYGTSPILVITEAF